MGRILGGLPQDQALKHLHRRAVTRVAGNLAMNFEPVYGIAAASFLFGEHHEMHPAFYLGAAAIIMANLLHPWFERRTRRLA